MAFWRKKVKEDPRSRRSNDPPERSPPYDPYHRRRRRDIDIIDYPRLRHHIAHRRFGVTPQAFDPEEYQRALEQGVVRSAYARVMFVGPGGIGKSSLLHGLMNKPLPEANSTQLADTVTVKPATKKWASAGVDSKSFWREVTDNDEIMELVGLVHLVARASAGHSASSRFIRLLEPTASPSLHTNTDEFTEIVFRDSNVASKKSGNTNIVRIQRKTVSDVLAQAVKIAKENPNAEAPEEEVLINVWDCGGQSIFLDVLPAFLTPRTMFLLFYDARTPLTDLCMIRSFHAGEIIDEHKHKATTLELMLEWMASIHAMLGSSVSAETVPKFPRIIPVGTHGDDPQVKEKKDEKIHQLNSECEGKAFAYLLKDSIIVDNTTAGQGELEDPGFSYIRRETYEFAGKDLSIRTPITWVLFRRVFKQITTESKSPIVFYQVAENIAVECGIPLTAISSAVGFYHDLAIFFHYTNVPSLRKYVIADPQWLICQFAKILVLEGFEKFPNDLLWKPLRKKGVLVQPLYEEVWKDSELPSQALVDLLVHFLLAAPIEGVKITNHPGKEYFVSLVLPAYAFSDCQSDSQPSVVTKQAAPLHLLFNTYYVPPGFFSRLVTTLLSKPNFQVAFSKGVYRDRIVLLYGHANNKIDEITLTKCKSSIEIKVVRTQSRPEWYMPFSLTCRNILNIITECFPTILHWLRGIELQYAFVCEHCPKKVDSDLQHYIRISLTTTVYTKLRCDKLQYAPLTADHQEWLRFSEDTQCTPDLKQSELEDVGNIIQSNGKVEKFAETLEMTENLKALVGYPNQAYELLFSWSIEMQKYASNLRSHLVHHLTIIGMDDIAYRLSRNRPLIDASMKLAGASTFTTTAIALQPQATPTKLDDVLDSGSDGVPKHLGQIADSMYEWEGSIAEELGLTLADVAEIKKKHACEIKLQVRETLQKWKQRLGHDATYRKLADAFIRAGHQDYADKVCEIIGIKVGSDVQSTDKVLQEPKHQPTSYNQQVTLVQTYTETVPSPISDSQTQSFIVMQDEQTNLVPQIPQQKSVPTLKLLQKELYKIADKWEDIGIQLDIDDDLLGKVKSDNHGDSKNCLREMLRIWVKKVDPQPSWTDLAEALKVLEEDELAQRLKDKYC